jgi:cellulose synthase/poly-beta-1,6-N-acetylglucosamine synthase-like glycosyltransferase
VLKGFNAFGKKSVDRGEYQPMVTVIIPAFNEADYIEETVLNKLSQNYPADKLEVIVVSDESTDGTDEIVKKMKNKNVRLIRQEPRAGKTSALNMAVPLAKGSVIVFSDANSIYDPQAVKKLIANFSDPEVGYVSGKMIYVNSEGVLIGDGCSAYMKYENLLRKYETAVGSIVGVDGGIDAVRKDLYDTMNNDQLPDFVLPLRVSEKGFRVVYEPEALLKEEVLKKESDEYKMRVRVSLRAIWALFEMRRLLFFKKGNYFFTWQLWSHKVFRYGCFMFLFSALLSNLMLLNQGIFYLLTFFIQIAFYVAALFSLYYDRKNIIGMVLQYFKYFLLLNIASAHAFFKFLLGKKQVIWAPRKG